MTKALDHALFIPPNPTTGEVVEIDQPGPPLTTKYAPFTPVPAASAANQTLVSGSGPAYAWTAGASPSSLPPASAQGQILVSGPAPGFSWTAGPSGSAVPPANSQGQVLTSGPAPNYAWAAGAGTPGPQGSEGPVGPAGGPGPQGSTGPAGPAATIAVGIVSTAPYTTPASVTNVGTSSAAIFQFVIPYGPGWSIVGSAASASLFPTTGNLAGQVRLAEDTSTAYVWTGNQWLSLGAANSIAGPVGPAGPQGVPGPTGLTGPTGPIGLTGPIGPDGAQGPIGSPGVPGPQGPTGPAGPPGAAGGAASTGPQPTNPPAGQLWWNGSQLMVWDTTIGAWKFAIDAVTNPEGGSLLAAANIVFAANTTLTTRLNGGNPAMSAIDNFSIDMGAY